MSSEAEKALSKYLQQMFDDTERYNGRVFFYYSTNGTKYSITVTEYKEPQEVRDARVGILGE